MAKKSLFDTLGARLAGAVVVDLYCGTGTMGLEAASRGAERIFFGEKDKAVISRLKRNIETLGISENCKIWPGDLTINLKKRLSQIGAQVDIAFVDPPYVHSRSWSWQRVQRQIFKPLAENLAPDGLVVVRLEKNVELPQGLAELELKDTRTYGNMAIVFLEVAS